MNDALKEVLEICKKGELKKLFVGDTENTLIQFFRAGQADLGCKLLHVQVRIR